MLPETYRECVREVFDLEAATAILQQVQRGAIRVTAVDSAKPSPYASALLFSYIANYIYDGDAPLAERRAQALSIDQSQLEEILGSTDFRELLDKAALAEGEPQLPALDPDYQARHTDGFPDPLLPPGELALQEIQTRSTSRATSGPTPTRPAHLTEARTAAQPTVVRQPTRWHGVAVPRRGRDALLDTIEILQGAAPTVSDLERELLPARVLDYRPGDLDALMASGNVVWIGRQQHGHSDGRIYLYLTHTLPRLLAPPP